MASKSPNGQRGPFFFNSPSKNDVHQYLIKIDHLLTASNRLNDLLDKSNRTIQLGGNDLPGFENRPADFVTRSFCGKSITHTFRSNLLNDVHFTFSRVAKQGGPVRAIRSEKSKIKITEPN